MMRRNLIKAALGVIVAMAFGLAGCGGGGGSDSSNSGQTSSNTTTPPAAKITSIVDGSWRIITDGSWGYRSGQPAPTASYPTDPFYLAIFDFVKFDNGTISGVTSTGNTWYKDGPFTVTNDVLEYTFVNSSIFTDKYFINPFTGKNEKGSEETKTIINEHVTINVTVSGSTMTWKDGSGKIVATFTRA